MSKKSLKGLAKTRHFIERQKERKISDKEILKAIYEGELVENDHGQHFILKDLKVTVDHALEVLITVLPKDHEARSVKMLSKEEARKIIEQIQRNKKATLEEPDEFMKYIEENKVRKIKR